jgi:methyl-accepting chemotaxis protein
MIDSENYFDDIRTAVVHSVLSDFDSLRDVASRTRDPAVREELQTTLDTVLQPAVDRVLGADSAAEVLLAADEYAERHRVFVQEKVQGDRQDRLIKRCDAMAASLRSYKRIDLRAAEQLKRFAEDLVERLDSSTTTANTGALVTQLTEYTSSLQSIVHYAAAGQETTANAMTCANKTLEEIAHTLRASMEKLVGPLHAAGNGHGTVGAGPAPGPATEKVAAGEPEPTAEKVATAATGGVS